MCLTLGVGFVPLFYAEGSTVEQDNKNSASETNKARPERLAPALFSYAAGAASESEDPITTAFPPAASMAFCAPFENLCA